MLHRVKFVFALLFIIGCSSPPPVLEDFDNEIWKADKHGCKGDRKVMEAAVMEQRDKLLGFEEMQLVDFLGKPDQNELSKRNEKFYYYYIDPAPNCSENGNSEAKRLSIRFNAMGLSKEILIE